MKKLIIILVVLAAAAGLAALVLGIVAAWLGAGLFPVAILCTLCVLVLETCL